ncbi:uncharacterized protein [Antedon mediterranea]|uniref:uncharacterized protein isoform X3 n=1 Tax=Antedon mediterranea TaxID=105859 RepID=UPI003AF7CC71
MSRQHLPFLNRRWYINEFTFDGHSDRHSDKKCSANSPYGHQELPTTSPLTNSSQLDTVRSISDDLHNLERKLEKERDRRTNTDSLGVAKFETKDITVARWNFRKPVAAPPESPPLQTSSSCCTVNEDTVLGDENMEGYKRNSFRPSARGTFFAREHYLSPNSNTFTNISNDNSLAMGALAITAPPSATSRKQQQSVKDLRTQPSQTLRSRGMLPMARERAKPPKYVYSDAVSGATPAFQQRISELTTLENETLRYERTRKLKKKTKQDRD